MAASFSSSEAFDVASARAEAAALLLKKDSEAKKYLSDAEIEEQFDLGYHLKHVDAIFRHVFGEA